MLATTTARRGLTALTRRGLATTAPWREGLDDAAFDKLRTLLAAPSPVGLEGAMTHGVLEPQLRKVIPEAWKVHSFRSQAALVVDTDPDAGADKLTVMVVGHADKIRMQVKKIANDGKVYIDSDSHLALTLLGRDVAIYSENAENPGAYRVVRGGTVEALGAIHFAEPNIRTGQRGIKAEQLYVELGIHGKNKKKQVTEGLGLRPGDSIIMERPIRRGVGRNTFTGAYLDNGLGCFVAAQACEQMATDPALAETLDKVHVLFAFATHEEIGRFGSRVLAQTFKPDVLVAIDVNHDYVAAPGIGSKQMPDLAMGEGPTLSVGSVTSAHLNATVQRAARRAGIPLQIDVVGRDTGTDAMAGVLASIDAASTSIGIPIRNMHTVSETGCTEDLVAATHLFVETVRELANQEAEGIAFAHPDLTDAVEITSIPAHLCGDDKDDNDSSADEDSKSS